MIVTAAAIAALSTLSGDAKAAQRWCAKICANTAQSTGTITLQGNASQERAEDAHRSLKSREEGQ